MKIKKLKSFWNRKLKILLSRYFETLIYVVQKRKIQKKINTNDEIVLVYSIGKVGSSSIYNSIKSSKTINIPIYHIHSLDQERIAEQKKYYKNSNRKSLPLHLIQSSVISDALKNYKGKVYIFTLMREPISREMSSIFQDSFNFTKQRNIGGDIVEKVVESKIKALVEELPEYEWFNRELKRVFGIDIFKLPFDIDQGYFHKKYDDKEFCLIRLENLNENFDKIIKEVFNMNSSIPLILENEAKNKFYSNDYKDLKNSLSIEELEFNKIINTSFLTKFYIDYIPTIKQKWLNK